MWTSRFTLRMLAFMMFVLVGLACKARKNDTSSTKDVVSISPNFEVTLTYIDLDETSRDRDDLYLFQGECGTLKSEFKFSDLWHRNLRDSCSKNRIKISFAEFEPLWEDQYLKTSQALELTKLDLAVKAWVLSDLKKKSQTTNQGESIPAVVNYSNPAATQSHSDWITAMETVLTKHKQKLGPSSPGADTTPFEQDKIGNSDGVFTKNLSDEPGGQTYTLNFTVSSGQRASAIEMDVVPAAGKECFLAVDSAAVQSSAGQIMRLKKALLSSKNTYELSGDTSQGTNYRVRFINSSLKGFDCKFTAKLIQLSAESTKQVVRRDEVMRDLMSQKHHRLAHFLWHSARNTYLQPGTSRQDRANIDALGWKPPRPVIYRQTNSGFSEIDYDATARSGAGEDFLYMHRLMIAEVRKTLAKEGISMYEPWSSLPTVRDAKFPLVAQENAFQSNDGFRQMLAQEDEFSPANIAKFATLSELGTHLEFKLHNAMHTRWAAGNWTVRPVYEDPISNMNNRIGWIWDRRAYDHLADPYSAHVNPIFWHLHGWVDQKIDDWLKAKGLTLKADCAQTPSCIEWRPDVWTGPDHSSVFSTVGNSRIDEQSLRKTRRLLGQNAFMNSLSR